MRSRFLIPAALLVTVAYVKGRLDANLFRTEEGPAEVPVATPPVDPILRAQAEAADAISIAEAQTAAAAFVAEPPRREAEAMEVARRDLSHLSEWLTTPTWGAPPPRDARAGERSDPGALAEWVTDPVGGRARHVRARDAFEAAAVAEWVTHVAPPALPERNGVAEEAVAPAPAPGPGPAPSAEAEAPVHDSETPAPGARTVPPEGDTLAAGPAPEPEAEAEPSAEIRIDESGRFSLGGWAAQPGHITLCGVTFRDRRDAPVDPSAIRLIPDAVSNVGDGGVVVLSDSGFAPDQEGFTVLLAAEGPGSFAASGRYEVIAAGA